MASELLRAAVAKVAAMSPQYNWVGIYLLQGDRLVLGPFVGEPTEHTVISVGQGVCGTAVAENADQNVPDVAQRANYLACSLKTRSELVVLIRNSRGEILGQIDIDSHSPNAFGPEDESRVRAVAADVAKEMEKTWNA